MSSLVTDLGLRAETTHRGAARDYVMRNGVVSPRLTGPTQVLGSPLLRAGQDLERGLGWADWHLVISDCQK